MSESRPLHRARSSETSEPEAVVAGLREEINGHLRAVGRTHLVEAVDKLTDEATLWAIIADARSAYDRALDADIWGGEFSLGSNTVYVRAVERVLGLEPGAEPSAGAEPGPA